MRAEPHPQLGRKAGRLAGDLGFAKTYDAEYPSLANSLGCRLAIDAGLRRATGRLGFVLGPTER